MQFFEASDGLIAVHCDTCDTRMFFRPEQCGSTLTCEMCGVSFTIPQQIKIVEKRKSKPRPVTGYELMDDDDWFQPPQREEEPAAPAGQKVAPLTPEGTGARKDSPLDTDDIFDDPLEIGDLAVDEPKKKHSETFALECRVCATRMHSRLDQVGEEIACPDCGEVMTVPPPPVKKTKKSPPKPQPVDVADEELAARPYADRLHQSRVLPFDPQEAYTPELTFFSDVYSIPFSEGGTFRWALFSLGLVVSAETFLGALALHAIGGLMLIGSLGLFVVCTPILAVTCCYGAACFLSIVEDTANGARSIASWPDNEFTEWFGAAVRLVFLGLLSPIPGLGVGSLLGLRPEYVGLCMWASAFLLFPLLLVSAVMQDRFTFPFSTAAWASLGTLWWGWLLVYAQSAVLLALWTCSWFFTFIPFPFVTALWAMPLWAAGFFICGRWYGRLIWRATNSD